MADQHFPGSHHGFDDLEHWLERNERFWVPAAVLILLVMVAFALSSIAHFYANSAIPSLPADW